MITKVKNKSSRTWMRICVVSVQYLDCTSLFIKVHKCKAIMLQNRLVFAYYNYCAISTDGVEVQFVDQIKYLAVLLDTKLNFCPYADYISKVSK